MLIKKTKIPVMQIILIGCLPGFVKRLIYKSKGYRIGKKVKFGIGSVIIGEDVSIGDYSSFGLISVVRGKHIDIRRYVTIGSMTMIDTEKIFIDEDARVNENVIIGGIKTPESMISLGKRTIVMEYSFINPTKPVIIGDDSGIGGHCLLFTHGSWLPELDGFPVTFAPITLGKKVWLPWRVFIMPGTTIGDEVVIGANSLVSGALPSNVLAAGSPAKILKENYPAPMTEEKRSSTLNHIFTEFFEYLRHHGFTTEQSDFDGGFSVKISNTKKSIELIYLWGSAAQKPAKKADLLVTDGVQQNQPEAVMTLDLVARTRFGKSDLGEEFTKYLSRHGVRFDRLD